MRVEGSAYKLIHVTVQATLRKVNAIPVLGAEGFERVSYPREAIHEIITNAVLHRDYSIKDEIHARIFNNPLKYEALIHYRGMLQSSTFWKNDFRETLDW